MFSPTLRRTLLLCRSAHINHPATFLPLLKLVPQSQLIAQQHQFFSTTNPFLSQIGRSPVILPPDVKLTVIPPPPKKTREEPSKTLEITGPFGTMTVPLPPYMTLTISETTPPKASLTVEDPKDRTQRCMWGTIRSLLAGHVLGVTERHTAILRLHGVGYRAVMENNNRIVNLKVGYAHPIELEVPEGVTASTPTPTRILLEGRDKMVVMQFAANIRAWRKPEPYKGKGIFVNNETIRLKAKKIK
ncbi:putative 60S ribosomal protein L6 [Kalaharituber pfeilii]|nr:putative 60S ribosomal protein L6 [Kalaharituber pfeilii]